MELILCGEITFKRMLKEIHNREENGIVIPNSYCTLICAKVFRNMIKKFQQIYWASIVQVCVVGTIGVVHSEDTHYEQSNE